MNKKIKNLFLAGAVIFSLAGVAVSCTDYDDDIDKLEDKTTTLETKVNDLTTKLTQAQTDIASLNTSLSTLQATVTKLQAEAATHATKTELENAVKDLEGKIATAKTEAIAEALKQAKAYADSLKALVDQALEGKVDKTTYDAQVAAFTKDINDLKDKAAEVEEDLKGVHATLDSLKKVTATNEGNIAANKENIEKNKAEIEALSAKLDAAIAKLGGKLKGLVFDAQAYVDGVPAIDVLSMDVDKIKINDQDIETEVAAGDGNASINGDVQALYYLNPSNATVTDAFKFEYLLNNGGNTPFHSTRSTASSDFKITPKFNVVKDGVLTLDLDVEGTPASAEYITIIKLQATEGSDTSIVSNEHTVYRNIFDQVLVANKNDNISENPAMNKDTYTTLDQHYRNNFYGDDTKALNAPDPKAYAPVNDNAIYNKSYEWLNNIDTTLTKGDSLNLKSIVAAHAFKGQEETELTDEQMKKLHLSWTFSLVGYKFADAGTNGSVEQEQKDYVVLNDTLLTVNADKGYSVNGRTPIIRAALKHDDDLIAVGYIKIGIKVADGDEFNPLIDMDEAKTNTFLFDCDKDSSFVIAGEDQLNSFASENGYSDLAALLKDYPNLVDKGADAGKVYMSATSDSIKWIIPMDSVWAHAGEVIARDIELQNGDGNLVIPVTLKAKVAEIVKTYDLSSAKGEYLDEYWWAEDRQDSTKFEITKFNVRVPKVNENTPDSCLFVNDLNAAFVTKEGRTVINNDPTINKVDFFFCKKDLDGNQLTFGDTTVTFTVNADTLLMVGNDTIAVIDNSGSKVPYSVLKLNKKSNVAKRLLNTDALYTFIGAKAYYCGKTNYPVTVTFDGKDHFRGDFIRPVYLRTNPEKGFVDAVDYGEEGSYIDLTDLVNPYDWRNRNFNDPAYSSYYWDYYGSFNFTVDIDKVTCDLNGADPHVAVPATIVLEQTPASWNGLTSKFGFLTYKNNGNNVSSFNLYVPVTVEYGWGQIKTAEIKVSVKGTN